VRAAFVSVPDDDDFDRDDTSETYGVLTFRASPGERNRVTVRHVRRGFVLVRDTGARLRAARGCRARGRRAAICRVGGTSDTRQFLRFRLGGGSDRLSVSRAQGLLGFADADGGPGNDRLTGGRRSDRLAGGPGTDRLDGGSGEDLLQGGPGADRLAGGRGDDRLQDGAGRDALFGGPGADVLEGGDGGGLPSGDRLDGGSGRDRASYAASRRGVQVQLPSRGVAGPGAPADRLRAMENVLGSPGDDDLEGDAGPNRLDGGGGRDRLSGGAGDDRLLQEPLDGATGLASADVRCGPGRDVVASVFGALLLAREDCELAGSRSGFSPSPSYDAQPRAVTQDEVVVDFDCGSGGATRALELRTPPERAVWALPGVPAGVVVARGLIPEGPSGSRCPVRLAYTTEGRDLLGGRKDFPVTVTAFGAAYWSFPLDPAGP
jgi:hypothetical protein